ncbi:MAG: Smr/MutS family protein [Verrucomicrobiaceae bacterium]|nr:Smr/MutS family protein [Verrucomicrobiaceae bacterium]
MACADDTDDTVDYQITSEIDLHTFRPGEVSSLLREYFLECRKKEFLQVRVIHGKGTGNLREGVHRLLDQMPDEVIGYRLGNQDTGGWGATLVTLRPRSGK